VTKVNIHNGCRDDHDDRVVRVSMDKLREPSDVSAGAVTAHIYEAKADSMASIRYRSQCRNFNVRCTKQWD
jgi:hypothetical protein